MSTLTVTAVVSTAVYGWAAAVGVVPTAAADPNDSGERGVPAPLPLPVARPMPADPARIAAIGGAHVSTTTPQGETAGLEAPLAAQAERSEVTVPMWAKDGIFAPTAHPNRSIAIHLPTELTLQPAAWTLDGGGIYTGADADYAAARIPGGGLDLTITAKSVAASTLVIGVTMPSATHLRMADNAVVVETDPAPTDPARVIGTFTTPAADDRDHHPLPVTVTVGPGFPVGQTNITIGIGPTNAYPATITLAYRASDVPATGAPVPNWTGLPAGTPGGAVAAAGVRCPGGMQGYTSADGRTADFTAACATDQECLAGTPQRTSVTACHDLLLGHLSIACTSTFGQTGQDYQECIHTAAAIVSTAKTTVAGPVEP